MTRNIQNANKLLMIKPAYFYSNIETAATNAFQVEIDLTCDEIQFNCNKEFNNCISKLTQNNIEVFVVESEIKDTPDALFPNNWVTFNHDGTVFYYPMLALNRRKERLVNVISPLKERFKISDETDFTFYEKEGLFLEGTGSIVFDHVNKVAFVALSDRTNQIVFEEVCRKMNYSGLIFNTIPYNGMLVYHTNVCLHVGVGYVVIAEDIIEKNDNYYKLINYLKQNTFEIIKISKSQMEAFAANMLQVKNDKNEVLLLMSNSAYNSLYGDQITLLQKHNRILCFDIPTIEQIGGGSIRCMLAEIFLPII